MGMANVAYASAQPRRTRIRDGDTTLHAINNGDGGDGVFPNIPIFLKERLPQSLADTNWSQESLCTYCDVGHKISSDQDAPQHVYGYDEGAQPVPENSTARQKHCQFGCTSSVVNAEDRNPLRTRALSRHNDRFHCWS